MRYFSLQSGSIIYARHEEDLFACSDGVAFPATFTGTYKVRFGSQFVPGFYECGVQVYSNNVGMSCQNDTECPSSKEGVNAECACSYSS